MTTTKKRLKKVLWISCVLFILMNVVAYFHAYKFTHFFNNTIEKTQNPHKLSGLYKLKTLLLGVNNPRPTNTTLPKQPFTTLKLKSNKEIE